MSKAETARQYLRFSATPALAAGAVLAEQTGYTQIAIIAAGLTVFTVRKLAKSTLSEFEAYQAGRKKSQERGYRLGWSARMLKEANQIAEQEEEIINR